MEADLVCNYASVYRIGRPRRGSLICYSWVRSQTIVRWHNVPLPINHTVSITISEDYCQGCEWFAFSANLLLAQPMYKCQITCKFPINDQSWGILTNQICENWNIILWLIVELSGEQASSILASLPTYLLKHLRPFLRCFHGYWFYSPLGVGIHDQHHDYRINDYGINQ